MPRIMIREKDNTTPGDVVGVNFSVVIPGIAGLPVFKAEDIVTEGTTEYLQQDAETGEYYYNNIVTGEKKVIFDSNGVYECSSSINFAKYVGLAAHMETIEAEDAVACELKAVEEDDTIEKNVTVYTREPVEEGSSIKIGYLVGKDEETGTLYKYSKLFVSDGHGKITADDIPEGGLYICDENSTLGQDASVAVTKMIAYGNQEAYTLLTLGYTVLYVLIGNDEIDAIAEPATFEALKDKSIYDFRYITHGLTKNTEDNQTLVDSANNAIKAVAETRGDCVALLEVDKALYTGENRRSVEALKSVATGDGYGAWFCPTVFYNGLPNPNNVYADNDELPGCFHYLACASKANANYPEWFAVSGYKRGIANLTVKGVSRRFGERDVQVLQPRSNANGDGAAVNPIIQLRNSFYIWGNRTDFALSTGLVATHFLNIRQLCSTLKKQIYATCRSLTFDPNSDVLWLNFCNAIRPMLERMKALQGIRDYQFVKLPTTMKAKLFAAIRIVPIEAVEDFEIEIELEDSLENPNIVVSELMGEYGRED